MAGPQGGHQEYQMILLRLDVRALDRRIKAAMVSSDMSP